MFPYEIRIQFIYNTVLHEAIGSNIFVSQPESSIILCNFPVMFIAVLYFNEKMSACTIGG